MEAIRPDVDFDGMFLNRPGCGFVAQAVIGLIRHLLPVARAKEAVKLFFGNLVRMLLDRKVFQVFRPLSLPPFRFPRDDFFRLRFRNGIVSEGIGFIEKRKLAVYDIHAFGLPAKPFLIRDPDLLDQLLEVIVQFFELGLLL